MPGIHVRQGRKGNTTMGKNHSIREVGHSVKREFTGGDLFLAGITGGTTALLGGSGKVVSETVKLRDSDGCVATGEGKNHDQAFAAALEAMKHAHNDRD